MVMSRQRTEGFAHILLLLVPLTLAGCGSNGPRTHAVAGRIELQGGEISQLVGSTLEVALLSEPTTRGFGQIQEDGRFALSSLQAGELRSGVLEGQYAARIIPKDEDIESREQATQTIDAKYLQFESSGLALEVPIQGEVTFSLSAP
jgi:hypothetical protein